MISCESLFYNSWDKSNTFLLYATKKQPFF